MAKVGGYWREAATLIIASKSNFPAALSHPASKSVSPRESTNKQLISCDYNVTMLKRTAKSKFMPNITVFPGGVISEADFNSDWISLLEEYKYTFENTVHRLKERKNVPLVFQNRTSDPKFLPAEVAFRLCAIRECFEECGILIARKVSNKPRDDFESLVPLSSADLNSRLWRRRVHEDAGQFLVMCRENRLVPDIWSLYEWSNWLTPVTAPVDKPPVKPHR